MYIIKKKLFRYWTKKLAKKKKIVRKIVQLKQVMGLSIYRYLCN